MSAAVIEALTQQIQELAPEEKWTLLSILVESLRPHAEATHRRLCDYYGVGKGRGFRSAQEVDTFIAQERASWEE